MEHFDWLTGAVFPYINFAIFAFLLVKLAKKPLQSAMATRRQEFLTLMESASRAKADAEARTQVLEERMHGLRSEIEAMTAASIRSAEQEANLLIENATKLAENMRQEAKRTIQTEMVEAQRLLRDELVKLAVQRVCKKAVTDVTPAKHNAIIQSSVNELNVAGAGGQS